MLQKLDLSFNLLHAVPDQIIDLRQLREVKLGYRSFPPYSCGIARTSCISRYAAAMRCPVPFLSPGPAAAGRAMQQLCDVQY
eukprot:2549630-Rhodomonas_salina.1